LKIYRQFFYQMAAEQAFLFSRHNEKAPVIANGGFYLKYA